MGNRCVGAKVNGKIVPLDYRLHTGDIVEILTSKHSYGPSRDWLKIVQASHARSKIRQWFKKEQRKENLLKGQEMLEKELRKHGLSVSEWMAAEKLEELARSFHYNDKDELLTAIGFGGVTPGQVVTRFW